jgi:hypothetical protein
MGEKFELHLKVDKKNRVEWMFASKEHSKKSWTYQKINRKILSSQIEKIR